MREIARCNSMFASEVRLGGLKLMIQHRSKEGLETAVWYLTNQHLHGSRERNHQVLKRVVETYGGHAKAMIPQLEQAAKYMEAGEGTHSIEDSRKKAIEVRQFITQIQAAPTPDWQMTSLSQYLK